MKITKEDLIKELNKVLKEVKKIPDSRIIEYESEKDLNRSRDELATDEFRIRIVIYSN